MTSPIEIRVLEDALLHASVEHAAGHTPPLAGSADAYAVARRLRVDVSAVRSARRALTVTGLLTSVGQLTLPALRAIRVGPFRFPARLRVLAYMREEGSFPAGLATRPGFREDVDRLATENLIWRDGRRWRFAFDLAEPHPRPVWPFVLFLAGVVAAVVGVDWMIAEARTRPPVLTEAPGFCLELDPEGVCRELERQLAAMEQGR